MTHSLVCAYCRLPFSGGAAEAEGSTYCCYGCRLADLVTAAGENPSANTHTLTRLGLGIVLTMLVMGFSLPLYSGDVYGSDPHQTATVTHIAEFLRYASLLLTAIVFLLLGMPILSAALDDAADGRITADALVVIGVAAAILYSYYAALTGVGGTYFETTCMVLVLFTLGRYLEATGKCRAAKALQALDDLLPAEVDVTRDGVRRTMRRTEIRIEDLVHVPAGQAIPVDGVIHAGSAHVDLRAVTGESMPQVRSAGDTVEAGTINLDGALDVHASAVGPDSTLGRLSTLLEQARLAKGRYQRAADRVVALFVPSVIVLALISVVYHVVHGATETAILAGLSVLLISCPCALGIATPTAVWIALGRAARNGVLIHGGAALEALAGVCAIAFDKTGTLTTREPHVTSYFNGLPPAEQVRCWALAAGLARSTRHVLSDALLDSATRQGIMPAPIATARTIPGQGVEGVADQRRVFLSSLPSQETRQAVFSEALHREAMRTRDIGDALACLSVDDTVKALFAFHDNLRLEARPAIRELLASGLTAHILSGDHDGRAQRVSTELGIPAQAVLTPAQKLDAVAMLRKQCGPVAMVGDGLNDAPALAGADVGIAMGCGVDMSRAAADICLLGDNLLQIPWTIALARRTLRTIRFNLGWAFAYNAVGIPLAMAGQLSPVFAAVAMVLGSLTVVANASRLETFDHQPEGRTA